MLKTIDLFAGAGGLSFGFQQTGKFQIVAAAEINDNARETYRKNIVFDDKKFTFINNVCDYDFAALNKKVGGIDVVIGGPPCQGFSNANRQRNHVINMNNGLVKEYFRAIKEIKPIAFVMENVSMLESDKHRFYDSYKDCNEINMLIKNGFNIPKRDDSIFISATEYEGVDLLNVIKHHTLIKQYLIPEILFKMLNTLNKHYNNDSRMKKYLEKYSNALKKQLAVYIISIKDMNDCYYAKVKIRMTRISQSLSCESITRVKKDIADIISLQKALVSANEIYQNRLIGKYKCIDGVYSFFTKSFSVIDYINAILGDEYEQRGDTLHAEWFGVPQYRRRHIIVGIRKDKYAGGVLLPQRQKNMPIFTVWDAIKDLAAYEVSYSKEAPKLIYSKTDDIGKYGILMRKGSRGISNHITTNTTPLAMKRFKAIEPGKNFHSLSKKLKTTYAKPERTQNTIYLRLNPYEPAGTVVNVRKSMWIHPKLDRAITVREAARLQSFPDKFIFFGTKDSQFQQVGNAVPPLLAKAIADNIANIL